MARGKIKLASYGDLKFYIYRNEYEIAHVHVEAPGAHCKIFLESLKIRSRNGFTDIEAQRILRWVIKHREIFKLKWNEVHGEKK